MFSLQLTTKLLHYINYLCFVLGFSILLWIGAFLCFAAFLIRMIASHETDTDDLILGIVLVVVVVVTGGFMYFQEHKSQKVSFVIKVAGL